MVFQNAVANLMADAGILSCKREQDGNPGDGVSVVELG